MFQQRGLQIVSRMARTLLLTLPIHSNTRTHVTLSFAISHTRTRTRPRTRHSTQIPRINILLRSSSDPVIHAFPVRFRIVR